jgi:hypothetical protein
MAKERWLVRLLIDRDSEMEREPMDWDWGDLIDGDPHVISAQRVGTVGEESDDAT